MRNYVNEGQFIHAGAPLFELSSERQSINGELTLLIAQQLDRRVESLESEQRLRVTQHQEKKSALVQHLRALDSESHQLQQEIELAKRKLALAQESAHKFQTLQGSGYVSAAQTQQKQEELIDLNSRISQLMRAEMELQANRQQIQADLATIAISLTGDLAQLKRAKASVEQEIIENNNRKSVIITAPQSGIITTITYHPGQAVNSAQVLATLIPEAENIPGKLPELEVQLYAPSRTAGFVAQGQKVLLRYHAFPYQKFGLQRGIITDVSQTPFSPNELPQNLASTILSNVQQSSVNANANEALYRIKVRPEKQSIVAHGREQPLKPGMTLDADILQENRKIWEWMIEPILALRQN